MGLFTKKRKDAEWVRPNDAIGAMIPYIMPKRVDAEVSSKVDIDVTELIKYIDKQNKNLDYKMSFFHAFTACMAKTIYNRKRLNRFVKNKRLYERKDLIFAFIAKDKMSDNGEERIVCVEALEDDNIISFSKRMAVDIFKVRNEGTNNMDGMLKAFLHLPKWLLTIVIKFIFFLDNHGLCPKAVTEGDTNYATVILSNLGSIKTDSCYHHLNEYGTNSIVCTIGTIREENGRKLVDVQITLDERIADGFYFAKSIKLLDYIARNPKLLEEEFNKEVEIKE